MKRSFFGLKKPSGGDRTPERFASAPVTIPSPGKAVFLIETPYDPRGKILLKKGDAVKTGQRIALIEGGPSFVATVTGTVYSLSAHVGDMGQASTAVTIEKTGAEETDETFKSLGEGPNLETAAAYLSSLPGRPPLDLMAARESARKIVVNCLDTDLLIGTRAYILRSNPKGIKRGIRVLKRITRTESVTLIASQEMLQEAGEAAGSEAAVELIDNGYPAALPHMIMKDVFGEVVPAGKTPEDLGVFFFSPEALVSIGEALEGGTIPTEKMLTVIPKNGTRVLAKARIGTLLRDIFGALDIRPMERDRIIMGGPMHGFAVYSEDHPVLPDTDGLMVQDSADVPLVSDNPCLNCGDCVRICPVDIPVNMLIRFLEVGQYEAGAEQYDLFCCIECGLCSYVCCARIPIFQYIRLGKYEIRRMRKAEASHG
jgi:Na+-translocating ferredoxin:NAD+ oxidoreductase subunit C